MQTMLEKYTVAELNEMGVNPDAYLSGLFQSIQSGDGDAFNKLVRMKSVTSFIEAYAKKLTFKFNNKITYQDIQNEFYLEMYNFIVNSYKIPNIGNSLLHFLAVTKTWIVKQVTKNISKETKTKKDMFFDQTTMQESSLNDIAGEVVVNEIKSTLKPSELPIFELYFETGTNIRQMSKTLNIPYATLYRHIEKIKCKVKKYLKEEM